MTKTKMTLSAIAKQAGVSIATVSRVLRKPQITSWSIRTKVHQAIKALNVDVNQIKKKHENVVATQKILVIDNQLLCNNLINKGIEEELSKSQYKIFYLRFSLCDDDDISQIIHYTLHNLVDGILIINDAPYLQKLIPYTHTLPPIVLINHFSLHFPCVYFDHLMTTYQATTHLLNSGYKRIAILLGKDNNLSANYLIQGYQQALSRANIALNSNHVITNCFSYDHGKQAINTLMQSNQSPTAILFTDHTSLHSIDEKELTLKQSFSYYHSVLGALHQCRQMNISIPNQLALLYFSHDLQKQYNELDTISSLYKPLHIMGKNSVQLLLTLLEKNNYSVKITHSIETEIVVRTTT